MLDLFAGIGTYSLPLSTQANVLAIEGEKTMVQALQAHIRTHQLDRLKTRQQDLFKQPVKPADLDKFDTIILNPPRAGAKAQCEQIAASNAQKITMISCNPATFVRDIRILQQAGFSIEKAMGVDQFIYSPHLELAATLSRA